MVCVTGIVNSDECTATSDEDQCAGDGTDEDYCSAGEPSEDQCAGGGIDEDSCPTGEPSEDVCTAEGGCAGGDQEGTTPLEDICEDEDICEELEDACTNVPEDTE